MIEKNEKIMLNISLKNIHVNLEYATRIPDTLVKNVTYPYPYTRYANFLRIRIFPNTGYAYLFQ